MSPVNLFIVIFHGNISKRLHKKSAYFSALITQTCVYFFKKHNILCWFTYYYAIYGVKHCEETKFFYK